MTTRHTEVRARIEALGRAAEADADTARKAVRKALADRHYLMVARAAELCGERLNYELEPDLLAAYGRLLGKSVQPLKRPQDRMLLRAAVLHRSAGAFDWLLEVVANGDRASAELVIRELAIYRANERLAARLAMAVQGRNDQALSSCFAETWSAG